MFANRATDPPDGNQSLYRLSHPHPLICVPRNYLSSCGIERFLYCTHTGMITKIFKSYPYITSIWSLTKLVSVFVVDAYTWNHFSLDNSPRIALLKRFTLTTLLGSSVPVLFRGWGIRALNDIPKGSFICTYAGAIYDEEMAVEVSETACSRPVSVGHRQWILFVFSSDELTVSILLLGRAGLCCTCDQVNFCTLCRLEPISTICR